MKKQTEIPRTYRVLAYIMLVYFLLFAVLAVSAGIVLLAGGGKEGLPLIALTTGLFACVLAFTVLICNRLNCRVWVEDGFVKRKGFWFGFRKQVCIEDIALVCAVNTRGCYLHLIHDSKGTFNRFSKKCYLSFAATRENLHFLATFWDGDVKGMEHWKELL